MKREAGVAAIALVAFLPLVLSEYWVHVLVVSLYYIIMAESWNLIAGLTGLFSLAHHAFAALGAYTSALLVIYLGVPIPLGMLAGSLAATAVSYLIGVLTLRMRAIYLALTTWAFAESFRILIAMEYKVTRGDLGLSVPFLYNTPRAQPHLYTFLALTVLLLLFTKKLVDSRVGYLIRSIRDDEVAAAVMGVDTFKWKKRVFALTGFMAGLAGSFYGHYVGLLSPAMIKFNEMAMIIMMAIIGGFGTLEGPIIGAPFIELISELTREYGELRMVVFAAIVIVIMRFYREGLYGLFKKLEEALK
ncbi:MAG: branched-chain amino acid ABC transporter permease [Thermoproteota archaeon]|nr:MAG: branched-chain amino acid ABC transporter permease [Candidatus Korarchaeota archaeon]